MPPSAARPFCPAFCRFGIADPLGSLIRFPLLLSWKRLPRLAAAISRVAMKGIVEAPHGKAKTMAFENVGNDVTGDWRRLFIGVPANDALRSQKFL